jgi:hypothetical protein
MRPGLEAPRVAAQALRQASSEPAPSLDARTGVPIGSAPSEAGGEDTLALPAEMTPSLQTEVFPQ